jgi:hypothetical protein
MEHPYIDRLLEHQRNVEWRNNFVPGGIRTPNLLIRSQKLYPVELQALLDM